MGETVASGPTDRVRELLLVVDGMQDLPYLGEAVDQRSHSLQTAALLAVADAAPALIAAGLLHDVGYSPRVAQGCERLPHEAITAGWLTGRVRPEVVRLVAAHVDAKRYLVAVEPGYLNGLSDASRRSLARQGGPMGPAEVRAHDACPWWPDAVALRRADEAAKVPAAQVPDTEAYAEVVRLVAL